MLFNEFKVPVLEMYKSALLKMTESMLSGRDFSNIGVFMPKETKEGSAKCFLEVFTSFGGRIVNTSADDVISAVFSDDGMQISIKSGSVQLDINHICAAVIKNCDVVLSDGIFLDKSMPETLKNLVPKGERIKDKRVAIADNYYNDATVCLLMLLSVITMTGETLVEIAERIPSFEIYTDEYIADINRGATMERLSKLYNDTGDGEKEGIHLHLAKGNVTVIPNRAKGFRIISEAVNMEVAKELAIKIGKAIKNEE